MPEFKILDFGTPKLVADKMFTSAEAATNTQASMFQIIEDILRIEEVVFHSQGRRGGGSWAALKPDTIRKKGTHTILRTSGANPNYSPSTDDAGDSLFRSVTQLGAPYQILEFNRGGFEFGTDRPWAFVHQYGSTKRNIKARPFLRFLPSDHARWNQMITRHILRAFETA